jgi:hypothetical protein
VPEAYVSAMETIPQILEAVWQAAPAGHEVVERDSVLRELWRLLQRDHPTGPPSPKF